MSDKKKVTTTADGRIVHILRTNARGNYPVVALYEEPRLRYGLATEL